MWPQPSWLRVFSEVLKAGMGISGRGSCRGKIKKHLEVQERRGTQDHSSDAERSGQAVDRALSRQSTGGRGGPQHSPSMHTFLCLVLMWAQEMWRRS